MFRFRPFQTLAKSWLRCARNRVLAGLADMNLYSVRNAVQSAWPQRNGMPPEQVGAILGISGLAPARNSFSIGRFGIHTVC